MLGVVENYAGEIFGEGGSKKLAKEVDTPFLGTMALRGSYRDSSKPTALSDPDVGEEYAKLADGMRKSLKEFGRVAA